jgi:SAM-dependent methyltransferase
MLKKYKDPIGHAIYDYYHKRSLGKLKVECSIAADDEIPIDYLFRSYEDFPDLEQIAMEFCKGKVLDVGLGAGCHAVYLKQRGLHVHGIDISPLAVEIAHDRGISAEHISIFELKTMNFDTILMLMNGLGIVGDFEGLDRFFRIAKNLLSSEGQIILESSDIKYMFEEEDGSYNIPLGSKFYGELRYRMSYKDVEGEEFSWLYLPFELLEEKAVKNGFTAEKLFMDKSNAYLARLRPVV